MPMGYIVMAVEPLNAKNVKAGEVPQYKENLRTMEPYPGG